MASDTEKLLQASLDIIELRRELDAARRQLEHKTAAIAFLDARVRLLECQLQRARRPFHAVPA